MTTKHKAERFRIRKPSGEARPQVQTPGGTVPPGGSQQEQPIQAQPLRQQSQFEDPATESIRREGLNGRQLRMARHVA